MKTTTSCPSRRYFLLSLGLLLLLSGCGVFGSTYAKLGDQNLKAEKYEEAMMAYQKAVKEDPFDASLQEKLVLARGRAAAIYEQRGREYLKDRKTDLAIQVLKQALRLDPSKESYRAAFSEAFRLKEARQVADEAAKLRNLGRLDEAMSAYERAVELDPELSQALDGIAHLSEKEQASRRTQSLAQPVTLRFRNAGLKEVFEGLSKAGGINIIFDKDVRNDPVTIFVRDTPFKEALNLILTSNNLFSREVGPDTLMISPNTRQKQQQYHDLMIRTFYLSNAKAKDMVTLLKSMLDTKRLYANEHLNAVVIRDRPEKLHLAEKIILANDRQEAEVLLDVEVLEVTRTKTKNYGLDYPKQAGVGFIPPGFTGTLTADLAQQFTYTQLMDTGGDRFLFKLPTTVILDFLKSVTDTKTLASPKLRVVNNTKAEINIGDKEPILLSTTNVVPGSTTGGGSPTTSTVTSIEFRDTGIKLIVEPSIRLLNELSLKLKVEFIRVGDKVTLQASPSIEQFRFGNRMAETTLNMKDGETVVIAGLIQEEDRRTKKTVPLLGDIPGLGPLFTSYDTQRVTTEVVVTITPTILRAMTPPKPDTQAFWSGTEFLYSDQPLLSRLSEPAYPLTGKALPRSLGPSPSREADGMQEGNLVIQPVELATTMGEEFQVGLRAENLVGLSKGVVRIDFDPAVLEFKGAGKGALLSTGATETSVKVSSPTGSGSVRLTIRREGDPVSGSGDLVTLTFAGKAPGVATLYVAMPEVLTRGKPGKAPHPGRGVVRVR